MQKSFTIARFILGVTFFLCLSRASLAGEGVNKPTAKPAPATGAVANAPSLSQGLSGSWQGKLLAPGISRFETIQSTVTFQADGSFVLAIDKSAGPLRQTGTYTLSGGVLVLNFAFGPSAPDRYKLTREADTLSLQALCNTTSVPMTLQPVKAVAKTTAKPTQKAP